MNKSNKVIRVKGVLPEINRQYGLLGTKCGFVVTNKLTLKIMKYVCFMQKLKRYEKWLDGFVSYNNFDRVE